MAPKFHKLFFLFCVYTVTLFSSLQAQEEVTYSSNIYAKVDSIYPSNEVIQVANFDNFDVEEGDIVMLYQVKGATHVPSFIFSDSKPTSEYVAYSNNTGRYEFFIIANIDFGNKLITTTRPLLYEYDDGETIQLVKTSFYFGNAVVNSDIEVQPWDPVNGIGGVFPIIVYQKLTLNADVIADGAGFKGGEVDTDDILRICNEEGEKFYLDTDDSKAANKGEGHVTERLSWTRGPGYIGNGGGGGFGKYSGGAGGANWGKGGQSGGQVSDCFNIGFENNGGVVNKGPGADFYNLENSDASNRILFGGGGGAGIGENELIGKPWATGGGNGGGIIIIICDSLESNSATISAKGETVDDVAGAGAGGAGAGGSVLIDAQYISGGLIVNVSGGDGGEINNSSICPGPGGGGGGGILWHSWESIPSNILLQASGGTEGGQPTECLSNIAWAGDDGSDLGKLRAPLNGFYFNKIIGYDEICGGQRPDTIRGTIPKGGNGDFDFLWEYSLDSINWFEYTQAQLSDSINFQPAVLYDTTYFRRLVTYNSITDTSLSVRIDVWPIIEDNLAQTNDQTICELDFGATIAANSPRGGDDNFSFRWEKSLNLTDWEVIEEDTTLISMIPGQLVNTTYYRRYIQSVVVCQDYSDTITITVQPGLENYGILEDIQSCQGIDADTLVGVPNLTGGNMIDYYHTWQIKGETGDWSNFGNDTTISYLLPGVLNDTSFFRRITTSGECIDTSNTVKVEVLVPISNNIVFGDDKICYGEEALEITNNGDAGGGNFVDYNFYWEIGSDTSNWDLELSQHSATFFPGELYDTTLIRRIVNSSACWDTSDYVTIKVVPEIINKLVSPDTIICEGFYPDLFAENIPTGGNGVYSYQWKQKQDGDWEEATGSNNNYYYQAPELIDTTMYYRYVVSDECPSISDTIIITVLPSISSNLLEEGTLAYTCFEIPKLLVAENPLGGDNSYVYQWEKSIDGQVWAEPDDNLEINYLTPVLQDSIYYRRIVFSGEYKQCKDTSKNLLLKIHPLPNGALTINDTVVCDGDKIPFQYSFRGASPWDVHFSDRTSFLGVVGAEGDLLKSYFGSDVFFHDTIVIDSLIDANGCKATEDSLSGFVVVKSYEVPSPKIIDAVDVCGESTTVSAKNPKFDAYWRGENLSFTDSVNYTSEVFSTKHDTVMTVIWSEQNNFCLNADTARIVFFKMPQLTTNFVDTVVYNKPHYELVTSVPEYDSVTWIAVDGLFDIESSGSTFANLEGLDQPDIVYQLVYRIDNGVCFVTDTLELVVTDISIPNVFTPNGDGINDYFYIEGLEEEGICKLTIINPWGNRVYYSSQTYEQSDNDLLFWDGKDEKGNVVPEGTYYYILEPGKSSVRKGFIIIKRKGGNGN